MAMDAGMSNLVGSSSSLSTCREFHSSSIGGGGSREVKALVVDDNRINQMLHHKLLDNLGVKNQVVGNGKEAVDIHVSGKQFDLILMDIDMPVMNGIEATRKLRDMGIRSVITGVSSHTLDHVKQEFIEAGIDEYHEKPLTSAKLLSILKQIKHKD
ncbi:hypothetical protein MLD38_031721 [Melastoma candidum]|uniref:Uncharacterized protein n=1 Tax=Melastoma candidum TaxID=119954 RepID=A0ACB9MR64_9MYRT|nr:hypothetical protein MLD38_031721 [Melastoma candidum]